MKRKKTKYITCFFNEINTHELKFYMEKGKITQINQDF